MVGLTNRYNPNAVPKTKTKPRRIKSEAFAEVQEDRLTAMYKAKPLVAETELKGGRTNYYLVRVDHPQREDQPPYQAECEDIIEALGLTFDEANILKEIWRSANARKDNGKPNHSKLYGAQKIVHYAGRILRKYQLEEHSK